MRYKAIVSFSGKIAMASGQVGEIPDESLAKDLLNAGYIIPFEADEKPKTRRKGKKNED